MKLEIRKLSEEFKRSYVIFNEDLVAGIRIEKVNYSRSDAGSELELMFRYSGGGYLGDIQIKKTESGIKGMESITSFLKPKEYENLRKQLGVGEENVAKTLMKKIIQEQPDYLTQIGDRLESEEEKELFGHIVKISRGE